SNIQRVSAEVIFERCFLSHFLFINTKFVDNNVFYFIKVCHQIHLPPIIAQVLPHVHTAVDMYSLARDVLCSIRCKEFHSLRNILHSTEMIEWYLGEHLAPDLLRQDV